MQTWKVFTEPVTYGTAQRQLDSHRYITHVFLLLHVPAFACAGIHAHQSILVIGYDACYSPLFMQVCVVCLIYTCSHQDSHIYGTTQRQLDACMQVASWPTVCGPAESVPADTYGTAQFKLD